MDIEKLDAVLKHKNIEISMATVPGELFSRIRNFDIDGQRYRIEWYSNASYLYCGNLIIPFHHVRKLNTWPINSKMNLQFYNEDETVCCILPIESWADLPEIPPLETITRKCGEVKV